MSDVILNDTMRLKERDGCFGHVERWTFINKGQNLAAFFCPTHKIVFKFIIRKKSSTTYLQRRRAFCEQVVLNLFPSLANFDPDNFMIQRTESLRNLPTVIQVLEAKSNAKITNTREYAVNVDISYQVCQKLRAIGKLNTDNNFSDVGIFSIEVKPKCGVLNTEAGFPELLSISRHKLLQFDRKGENCHPDSVYDPLHLFSSNTDEQLGCVEKLLSYESPYLKLYHNGSRVTLSELAANMQSDQCSIGVNELPSLFVQSLNGCGIMKALKCWQSIGAISVCKAKQILEENSVICAEIEKAQLNYDNYNQLISCLKGIDINSQTEFVQYLNTMVPLDYVRLYLLGASAADVSLFLSFVDARFVSDPYIEEHLLKANKIGQVTLQSGAKYFFSCNLIDVDCKGVKTVLKQFYDLQSAVKVWRRSDQSSSSEDHEEASQSRDESIKDFTVDSIAE